MFHSNSHEILFRAFCIHHMTYALGWVDPQQWFDQPNQSCPRVTFLGPDPTRRNVDPTRPAIADTNSDPTRPDPRPDLPHMYILN